MMKVSIVTPSYNQGPFIARTLKSVAIQEGVEIEHVVFDGGSTDDTVSILKSHAGIVKWVSEKDKGQADAVNKGITATSGDIIGWLNSDDIYYPEAVKKVVNFFKENDEVDVVYGMADHIDISDNPFEEYPTESWDFERLKETCFICQPALFFRRKIVNDYGLLNESLNYCMDYEYWLRLGKSGVKFGYLEAKLAGSRLYPETKTLGARVKVHAEINSMFRVVLGTVPDRWLFNYAHAVVNRCNPTSHLCRLKIATISLMAALRWNRRISKNMVKITCSWILRKRQ